MNRLIRDEKGYALAVAIILLLISGLLIGPLLAHMASGRLGGAVYEKRTHELYAADAGVEDAVWRIRNHRTGLPPPSCANPNPSTSYVITDVNDRNVGVTIRFVDARTYRVTSTATTGNKSRTTIMSYLNVTFKDFFDNAITSQGNIIIQPGSTVTGDVQHGGTLTNHGTINGTVTPEKFPNWPNATALSNHFLRQVQGATDPGSPIAIGAQRRILPPSFRRGNLDITNTGGPGTLVLNGTLYVDGNLNFKQPGGGSAYTIDLNGQTIFVTGSITFPAHRVSISGSGCIIAIGDIVFQPAMQSNPGDFVFVMSVAGMVRFQPRGTFYGSLAGFAEIRLQPGCRLIWRELSVAEKQALNFPIQQFQLPDRVIIVTWEVSRQ